MNRFIISLLIIIFLFSCSNQENNDALAEVQTDYLAKIVLIDTNSSRLRLDTAHSITKAEFHPLYIGDLVDSLWLNYNSKEVDFRIIDWDQFKTPDSSDLKIFIDTSQVIGSGRYSFPPPPPGATEDSYNWKQNNSRGVIKSYPLIIENIGKDTLDIGYGEYLPLIIEAKDSLGDWRPIQEPFIYFCGTGLSHFYLPPQKIAITSCKKFEGNFKTKIRVVYGFNIPNKSNEFWGTINYKQFEEPKNNYN